MNELIFPPEVQLEIENIKNVNQRLDIDVRSQRTGARCPDCQRVSTNVHGRYWRHPQDLPCLALTVRLHIEVRRFACRNSDCPGQTFNEDVYPDRAQIY